MALMNVENILANYERAIAEKASQSEAERVKDKLRRQFNAEAIQKCIRGVIEPVMADARGKLVEAGYPCDVGVTMSQDAIYPEPGREWASEIKLRVSPRKGGSMSAQEISFQYLGSFEGQGISTFTILRGKVTSTDPVPVDTVARASVEKDVAGFLAEVFTPAQEKC